MPTLYGHQYSKEELRARCGQMAQLAGVSRYELQDGFERGVEICDVRTGSGFRFCVSPSRGMDITFAEHNGRPLCWNSSTGIRHPAYYSETNLGWLRGFYGGCSRLAACKVSAFPVKTAASTSAFTTALPIFRPRTFPFLKNGTTRANMKFPFKARCVKRAFSAKT